MFFQVANAHLLLLNESGLNSHFISTFIYMNIYLNLFGRIELLVIAGITI